MFGLDKLAARAYLLSLLIWVEILTNTRCHAVDGQLRPLIGSKVISSTTDLYTLTHTVL